MRLLFDHNFPRSLRRQLAPHEVVLTREAGWEELDNGELLDKAQKTFAALLTTDTNIYHRKLPGLILPLLCSAPMQTAVRSWSR